MSVEDQIAPALAAAGLTTASARFDPGIMTLFRSAEFTTPLYDAASLNPWQAPYLFNVFTNDVDSQAGKPNEIMNIGAHYLGNGTRRTLIPARVAQAQVDINNMEKRWRALVAVRASGNNFGEVPPEVQQATLLILDAMPQVQELYDLFAQPAYQGKTTPENIQQIITAALKEDSNSTDFAKGLDIFHRADTKYLFAGGNDLLLAVQQASKILATVPESAKYRFEFSTKFGAIAVSGGEDSTYNGPHFLIIDTGGNDTYINAPCATPTHWASIAIDTNGNDKYLSDPVLATQDVAVYQDRKTQGFTPGPCGAFMGYAYLFDLRGDDLYRSARDGIASGRLGIAFLEDSEGNDTYDGYQDSLGFGNFGAGIIEDVTGNDHYGGFAQVQGVGLTAGFGAVIDHAGNDVYVANDTVIDFPAAQKTDKPHNSSMSLGAGNGVRRDYLDAHQLAGGIGLLLDGAGDDQYSGGVFAEGCGYLEGIGILRDRAGTDIYNGIWYVQGAAAHFAVGYLQDDEGDDHYTATTKMSQGGGHDFSAGYLLDLAGNDSYVGGNTTLGAANSNGIGLFLDAAGDDKYSCTDISMGQSGDAPKGLRERALSLGVFCDLGGNDTYPSAFAWAKNGGSQVSWVGKQRVPEESQLGVFFDK